MRARQEGRDSEDFSLGSLFRGRPRVLERVLGQHLFQAAGSWVRFRRPSAAAPPAGRAAAGCRWASRCRGRPVLRQEGARLLREGAARHEDDPLGLLGRQPRQLLVELGAGHLRHHQVAQDGVEAPARGELRQRLRALVERGHLVVRAPSSRWRARPTTASSSTTSTRRRRRRLRRARRGGSPRLARAVAQAERGTRCPGPARSPRRCSPPISVTMRWQMDSPRPVPTPTGLVVKKGSKMRSCSSGGMPRPGVVDLHPHVLAPSWPRHHADLVLVAWPSGMAWAALTSRLRNTCPSRASLP